MNKHKENTLNRGIRTPHVIAAIAVIGYLANTVYWESVWDHAEDGLSGLSITLFGSLAAVAAGIVLAIILRGWQRFTGPVLAVLVPLLLWQVFHHGDQVSYHELTEKRASRIELALERYYSAHGRYPTKLSALNPYYILSIPEPIILRQVGWCYQGGEDHYWLGNFYREGFGSPVSFRMYAQAGDLPDSWTCEEKLESVQTRYPPAPDLEPDFNVSPPETLVPGQHGVGRQQVTPFFSMAYIHLGRWSEEGRCFSFTSYSGWRPDLFSHSASNRCAGRVSDAA
jgi:hypothetical protein